jgi:Flp pilus assembly pilin Flp
MRQLFVRDENGQTLVEYGLILALVAIIGFVGVLTMSGGVSTLYEMVKAAGTAMQNTLGS